MVTQKKEPIDIRGIDKLVLEEINNLFPDHDNDSSFVNSTTLSQLMQLYSPASMASNACSRLTIDQLLAEVTYSYIEYARNNCVMEESVQAYELLNLTNYATKAYAYNNKGMKPKHFDSLLPMQVSMLMIEFKHVIGITLDDSERPESIVLAIYQMDGPKAGIYDFDVMNYAIIKEIGKYNRNASDKYCKEVISFMFREAPIKRISYNCNLIPLNNGIYDYENKRFIPYSSEYIFTSKYPVNYNDQAYNVCIQNDDGSTWDVESWMKSLSDDPAIVDLLWEVLAACIRSNNNWSKAIFFLARSGNNGKGTLCQLIRNLVGSSACVSMSMDDFTQKFTPEELLHASMVLGEENSVGHNLEDMRNFKCAVTHDPYLANIKYGGMKNFRFRGLIIQCINDMIRTRDKTGSFARRLLIIPFEKEFTGIENKRIKNEYLARQDVLEYIMFRLLNMRFSEFSEPVACINALSDQRVYNDPIRQYWEDFRDEFSWDFLPLEFLYDLYKAWFSRNIPGVNPIGRNMFMSELREIVAKDSVWTSTSGQKRVEESMKCVPEPLIAEYRLEDWKNPNYTGNDIQKVCIPKFKDKYIGIIRR